MKKFVLEIDQLRVDSYATSVETASERGTVWGHDRHTNSTKTLEFSCVGTSCGNPTNAVSCNYYSSFEPIEYPMVDGGTEAQYPDVELPGMA